MSDKNSYWEARYEIEREKRFMECDGCETTLKFDANRPAGRATLEQTTIPFRCRVCGRVYCRDCSIDHFGLDDNE